MSSGDDRFLKGLVIAERFRVVRLLDSDGRSYTFQVEVLDEDGPQIALRVFDLGGRARLAAAEHQIKRFALLKRDSLLAPNDVGRVPPGEFLGDWLYMTRDLGERTLSDLVGEGEVGFDETRRVALQVSDALVALHENDLVHMDLTPANTIRMRGWKLGEPSLPRILDRDASVDAMTLRDVPYIAPEYFHGGPAPEADIYSFGALIDFTVRGAKAGSWFSEPYGHRYELEVSEAKRLSQDFDRHPVSHWLAISTLCTFREPPMRPTAPLLRELVASAGESSAPILRMLSFDGVYHRSYQFTRSRWEHCGLEKAAGGQRELAELFSTAAASVLAEAREYAVQRPTEARLEHDLIRTAHRLIGERYGEIEHRNRTAHFRYSLEEALRPPVDTFWARLRRRLSAVLPMRRPQPRSERAESMLRLDSIVWRSDRDFRSYLRERISNQLSVLADPALAARAGSAADPDQVAEAVLEELSLNAEVRDRIRAEEQIDLEQIATRREGAAEDRSGAAARLADEGALALPTGDTLWFPSFQFDQDWRMREEAATVNRELGAEGDPWGVASWWFSANGRIGERAPRELIDEEPARLPTLAKALSEPIG